MVLVRRARESDGPAILALRRGERLNPKLPPWDQFTVATIGREIVGAAAVRIHADGTRELGSLVVAADYRGLGIAALLIREILAGHPGEIFMITARAHAGHYARFGFLRIPAWRAPIRIGLTCLLGTAFGWAMAQVQRRAFNPLAILRRAATHPTGARDLAERTSLPVTRRDFAEPTALMLAR